MFWFQASLQQRQTSVGGFRRDYFIFQWMISFKTWRYIRRTNFKWAPPIDAKNNYVSCANQLLSNEKHSYSNLNSKFILKFSLKIYHLFNFFTYWISNCSWQTKKYEKIKPINKKTSSYINYILWNHKCYVKLSVLSFYCLNMLLALKI